MSIESPYADPSKLPHITGISHAGDLEVLLARSSELAEAIFDFAGSTHGLGDARSEAALAALSASFEHAAALRLLMAAALGSSATSLMRLQYEALVRAMWILWAASDRWIEQLGRLLSKESEQATKNLPLVSEMLEKLRKRVGHSVPAMAYEMVAHFRDASWGTLNSYVHGGIHALRRAGDGFPVYLAGQVVRSSNGLITMAAMLVVHAARDGTLTSEVQELQRRFSDCLPPSIEHPVPGASASA